MNGSWGLSLTKTKESDSCGATTSVVDPMITQIGTIASMTLEYTAPCLGSKMFKANSLLNLLTKFCRSKMFKVPLLPGVWLSDFRVQGTSCDGNENANPPAKVALLVFLLRIWCWRCNMPSSSWCWKFRVLHIIRSKRYKQGNLGRYVLKAFVSAGANKPWNLIKNYKYVTSIYIYIYVTAIIWWNKCESKSKTGFLNIYTILSFSWHGLEFFCSIQLSHPSIYCTYIG